MHDDKATLPKPDGHGDQDKQYTVRSIKKQVVTLRTGVRAGTFNGGDERL